MPVKSRVPFGLQKKILKDLKHNQEAPTPRKKSHTQIANAHSTNKLIITVDRVRKMNAHYKASRLRRGQAVTRTIPPAPGRAEVPARIKLLILEDLNITQEQVRRKLKLSTNQFATVMSQFGLTFRGMKVKERKKAIATLSFVIKPGTSRNFTNREIAEELGLGARYVEEHRPRRGKSSGSKAQIEAVM